MIAWMWRWSLRTRRHNHLPVAHSRLMGFLSYLLLYPPPRLLSTEPTLLLSTVTICAPQNGATTKHSLNYLPSDSVLQCCPTSSRYELAARLNIIQNLAYVGVLSTVLYIASQLVENILVFCKLNCEHESHVTFIPVLRKRIVT